MATTSFIYHCFGIRGYQHLRTVYCGGAVYHHIERNPTSRRCAGCQARWENLTRDGAFERTFHALPVGPRQQFLVLHGHRQACKRCGRVLREPIPFADGKRRYIRAFGRFVNSLCRLMPIKQVAGRLGVGWDLVKEVYKEHLKRRRLKKVRRIGVDEFAVQKGHRYMTIVLDLHTGEIVCLIPRPQLSTAPGDPELWSRVLWTVPVGNGWDVLG